jgi:hypothetical protein
MYQHVRPEAKASGDMFYYWMDWMIAEFDAPLTLWEDVNESKASHALHFPYADFMDSKGIPKKRRLTSNLFKGFYKKKRLYQKFTCSIHQVDSIETYEDSKRWMPRNIPWLPSGDGPGPIINPTHARQLVKYVLDDGMVGYEGNDRPFFHQSWDFSKLNWDVARAMGRALRDYIG